MEGYSFESLIENTNTIIEQNSNTIKTEVTSGQINNPSVQGYPLNKNLKIDYTISFKPMNSVPQEGMFTV